MKVIVSESKLGIEYLADVISSCNQNGIECIVDDNAGEILYYLPKEGRYGDDRLLQNSDESIFDLVRNKERLVRVLRDAKGDEFKKFAVKWNGLQTKGDDEEVYKTDHCNPIRGNFSEGADNTNDWLASENSLGESDKYDVEIEFTAPMDGREFEKGQKETVTLDLADMPKTYDIDRLKYEIACIISKTLPGKGFIPGWRFKVLNEEDLIKEVMGDKYKPLKLDDIPDEMTFDEAMDYYNDLHDAYYDHRIKYDKLRDICKTLKDAVVKNLLKTASIEELGREWFKDYGTMNGWDAKRSFEYGVADALHEIHKKKHPEEHKVLPQRRNCRGWHEDNCSCGLCSSSDSSD